MQFLPIFLLAPSCKILYTVNTMGFFITFEGIEGCGKSTQVRLLTKALEETGIHCIVTREPGGTSIGSKIRDILLNPDHKGMAAEAELLLYAADRAQHVREDIKPSIDNGKVVVCDRFADATLAYQGFGRGLNMATIHDLNRIASLGIRPDLTLLLDCPVETGIGRALERNSNNSHIRDDRFEREALAFHRKVREGYLTLAQAEPERIKIVDARNDVESVRKEIWGIVKKAMSNDF